MSRLNINQHLSKRATRVSASIIRELCKLANLKDLISLAGGWPNPDAFPYSFTRKTITKLMKEKNVHALQYGASEGYLPLRQWLSEWLKKNEGINANVDEILISSGAQNGMDLCCRVLVDEEDICLVELPTYFGGIGSIRYSGGEIKGIPTDREGVIVDEIEKVIVQLKEKGKKVKLMYIQPSNHNPLGVTLSNSRRKKLLKIAQEYDFFLMEDNPYGDLFFTDTHPLPIKSMDDEGRVIYIKSFAKIFSPGLRLAVVVAHPEIISKMVVARQFVDCCPPSLSQLLFYEFCKSGTLTLHIKRLRKFYYARMKKMLKLIKKYFPPEVVYTQPQGGMFIFAYLPEEINADNILAETMKENVVFVPGKQFFIDGSGASTMRICFAQVELNKMEKAIQVIAEAIRKNLHPANA